MTELNKDTLKQFITENQNVVVDLWAPWCGPCKVMIPTLEQIISEGSVNAIIIKVNVDENREVAMEYGVRGIPTLLFFKDGQLIDKSTGALSKQQLIDKINLTFNK